MGIEDRIVSTRDGERLIMTEIELKRFRKKFIVNRHTGCWEWTGARNGEGYSCMAIECRSQLGHRLSYMHHIGPIPINFTLDHRCRNRRCVNPRHLKPMTLSENAALAYGLKEATSPYLSMKPDVGGKIWLPMNEIIDSKEEERVVLLSDYNSEDNEWDFFTGTWLCESNSIKIHGRMVDERRIEYLWWAEVDDEGEHTRHPPENTEQKGKKPDPAAIDWASYRWTRSSIGKLSNMQMKEAGNWASETMKTLGIKPRKSPKDRTILRSAKTIVTYFEKLERRP